MKIFDKFMVPGNEWSGGEALDVYSGMLSTLGDAFKNRYRRDVNLTGILLVRPQIEFAQKEVLPHINYWHHRSDSYTDFFCPGYSIQSNDSDRTVVAIVEGKKWFFSDKAFAQFLEQIEHHTSWRYGGGCELIVTNARYDRNKDMASLDLRSAIVIDLAAAHQDKAFRDVGDLCEQIFQFAKNLNEAVDDPCWEFSDSLGFRVVKRSLREFLIGFLPRSLKPEARKAFYFVTKNLEPPAAAAG